MNLNDIKRIDWQRIEENRKISLYPVMVPGWTDIINGSKKIIGIKQNYILCAHIQRNANFYGSGQEWDKIGRFILKKILNNPSWGEKANQEIIRRSHVLINFSSHFLTTDLSHKSKEQLVDLYQQYEKLHGDLYCYAIIPVFLDLYQPLLSDYLMNYLENKKLTVFNASEVFGVLTTPNKPSQVHNEELALMQIAQKIKGYLKAKNLFKKNIAEIKKNYTSLGILAKQINAHYRQYSYQGYNWEGPPFAVDYFLKRLKEFVANQNLKEEIERKINYHQKIKQKQQQYLKAVKLDIKHQRLFKLTGDFIFSKDFRKDYLVKSYWQIEPLLAQLANRLHLSSRQVRNLSFDELREISAGKKISVRQNCRLNGAAYVVLNGQTPGDFLVGIEAKKVFDFLKSKEKVIKQVEVSGQVAYPGKVTGRVRIVEHPKDILNMKKGDILVAHMTNPDLVSGMKLAGGIVTETGGITCHAAIVSRELGKPCVIGTKIATRVFKEGDLVEVDANKGIVKKI
jgi:phosphohistidine swiveling domain-containing protein